MRLTCGTQSVMPLWTSQTKVDCYNFESSKMVRDGEVIKFGSTGDLKDAAITDPIEFKSKEVEEACMSDCKKPQSGVTSNFVPTHRRTFSKDDIDIGIQKSKPSSPPKSSFQWIFSEAHLISKASKDTVDIGQLSKLSHEEQIEETLLSPSNTQPTNPASLSTVLENIPLTYCPRTKSLQIKKSGPPTVTTDEAKITTDIEENDDVPTRSSPIDDTQHLCPKISEDVLGVLKRIPSFSHTDCSSFCGSLSSLSTDYSISTAGDASSLVDEEGELSFHSLEDSLGSCSKAEDMGNIPSDSIKSKRRIFPNIWPRGLFHWRSKEQQQSGVTGQSSSSRPSTGDSGPSVSAPWRLFSRRPTSSLATTSEPLSTTGLILETRPTGLPAKSQEEHDKHQMEYNALIESARKKKAKQAKMLKKQLSAQIKQEEFLGRCVKSWTDDILPHWDDVQHTKKVQSLWWHGLPPSVRGKVWPLAIGNCLNLTPELYHICKERTANHHLEQCATYDTSVSLITLDVSRTFPQLGIFQKGGPYHDVLHNVLGSFASYRPDIGYVQGMSFLAAVLILNMAEDLAFVCFSNLVNTPCMLAFFTMDSAAMSRYYRTYEQFLCQCLPTLARHLDSVGLTPDLYLLEWLVTIFSKTLPLDVASRVWDLFCRDGEEALFRVALGLLHYHQDALLTMDFSHAAEYLSKLGTTSTSMEQHDVTRLFKCVQHIDLHLLDKRRWGDVMAAGGE